MERGPLVWASCSAIQTSVRNGLQALRILHGGFSILEELSKTINVGKAMGFNMKGCEKNVQSIIKGIGDTDLFK